MASAEALRKKLNSLGLKAERVHDQASVYRRKATDLPKSTKDWNKKWNALIAKAEEKDKQLKAIQKESDKLYKEFTKALNKK